MNQPGRNDPCPCGSGKKYKKCHGASAPAQVQSGYDEIRRLSVTAFHHGEYSISAAHCRQLLQSAPNDFAANHILGLSEIHLGNSRNGLRYLQIAARINSRDPTIHSNLSYAHYLLGEYEYADRCARTAITLDPQSADAYNNLGQALLASGSRENAISAYRTATQLAPDNALLHSNLGTALFIQGEIAESEESFLRSLEIAPHFAPALAGLGAINVYRRQWQEARTQLEEAISGGNRDALVFNNLGLALDGLGDPKGAMEAFQKTISLNPDSAGAHFNLGRLYESAGDLESAIMEFKAAQRHGHVNESVYLSSLTALIGLYGKTCNFTAREKTWQEFQALYSDGLLNGEILGLALLNSCYTDCLKEDAILHYHKEWGKEVTRRTSPRQNSMPSVWLEKGSRIKLGYVSPDFREHSVGYFIRHVLENHDRESFEIFCYSASETNDAITDRIRSYADHFQVITQYDDEALASKIRSDGVNCLIDLAGHTSGNRLKMLAFKPAPMQCTWIGYLHTTGLQAVDYRITDPFADDPAQDPGTEKLLILPESFLCFGSFPEVDIDPVPAVLRNGYITFASLNNLAKITRETIRVWANLLRQVQKSRLLIMATGGESEEVKRNILAEFKRYEITSEQIQFRAAAPRLEYLDLHNSIDIALDSWPFNGGTVTAGALWMGVPLITLVGNTHRQRISYSMLNNIGVTDTITWSETEYVDVAVRLANDPDRLGDLRRRISAGIRASILCNPSRFTRQLEKALTEVWSKNVDSLVPEENRH